MWVDIWDKQGKGAAPRLNCAWMGPKPARSSPLQVEETESPGSRTCPVNRVPVKDLAEARKRKVGVSPVFLPYLEQFLFIQSVCILLFSHPFVFWGSREAGPEVQRRQCRARPVPRLKPEAFDSSPGTGAKRTSEEIGPKSRLPEPTDGLAVHAWTAGTSLAPAPFQ